MEQFRFQYKKFWESGAFQETYIGLHKTFDKYYLYCHHSKGLKLITRLKLG